MNPGVGPLLRNCKCDNGFSFRSNDTITVGLFSAVRAVIQRQFALHFLHLNFPSLSFLLFASFSARFPFPLVALGTLTLEEVANLTKYMPMMLTVAVSAG
jgi:hypothetical protein